MCSFYRPPPLTSYHHLLDPASAAATRPLLLAAGLYGANSLALPPPIPPSVHAPPAVASILPTTSNEDRRASSCGGTTTVPSTGGPLDLSHLASNHHHQSHHHHLHVPGLVDNCNGALGGGTGSVGKLPSAASVHSFLQLHKSAGKKGSQKFFCYNFCLFFFTQYILINYRRIFFEDPLLSQPDSKYFFLNEFYYKR